MLLNVSYRNSIKDLDKMTNIDTDKINIIINPKLLS